jgi:hypothetical protein
LRRRAAAAVRLLSTAFADTLLTPRRRDDAVCESWSMANDAFVVHAGRPRHGRRFEPVREQELSADALRAAQSLPNAHRGIAVLLEAAGPFGVPDVLAVVGPPQALEARLRSPVPPLLNQVDAGVVASAAFAAPRTLESLAGRVGWSEETVARRLPHLVRVGALTRVGSDRFVRPEELVPVGRLYAIEAKVKDWRRALKQARTYAVWCDSYVIVMPELGRASTPAVTDATALDGGGLMMGGKWVHRPRIRARSNAQRLWGSEHVIAAFYA